MRRLIVRMVSRSRWLASSRRGRMPSRRMRVLGKRRRISSTMARTACAMSAGESPTVMLLVPIKRTTALGWMLSSSPFCIRHKTFSVASPEMPKLAACLPAKRAVQTSRPSRNQHLVSESPIKSRSMPPLRAWVTLASCCGIQFSFPFFGSGVAARGACATSVAALTGSGLPCGSAARETGMAEKTAMADRMAMLVFISWNECE